MVCYGVDRVEYRLHSGDAAMLGAPRGGRHLKPEYFIRVDEARKTVSRAKDELRALLANKK